MTLSAKRVRPLHLYLPYERASSHCLACQPRLSLRLIPVHPPPGAAPRHAEHSGPASARGRKLHLPLRRAERPADPGQLWLCPSAT